MDRTNVVTNQPNKEVRVSSKFIPVSEESMDFLAEYMKGFWKYLKSPAEKAYCAERAFHKV